MYDATSQFEVLHTSGLGEPTGCEPHQRGDSGCAAHGPGNRRLQRVSGVARLGVRNTSGASRVSELYQEGAFRLRLPRPASEGPPEVITINTAGGLTGGDRLDLTVNLDRDAEAIVSSQACERIYRSADGAAGICASIDLGPASRLDWLAQPMIVFDRSNIRRTFAVNMAEDATLLAVDGLILGRTAMGEETNHGLIHDGWRIRRGAKLVLADAFRAGPDISAIRARPAALGARRALATIIYCAPDAERRLPKARAIAADLGGDTAASAWNGCLLVRFVCDDGQRLIADLMRYLSAFRNRPMPRTWTC